MGSYREDLETVEMQLMKEGVKPNTVSDWRQWAESLLLSLGFSGGAEEVRRVANRYGHIARRGVA